MRLKEKLSLGFLLVSMLPLMVSFFISNSINKQAYEIFQQVGGENLPGTVAMARMASELYRTEYLLHEYSSRQDDEIRQAIETSLAALDTQAVTHTLYHHAEQLETEDTRALSEFNRLAGQYLLLVNNGSDKEALDAVLEKIDSLLQQFSRDVAPHLAKDIADSVGKVKSVHDIEQKSRYILFGSAGIILVLAMLLSLYLARRIAAPLRELTDAVEQAAECDFDRRVPVHTRDEVGELARAFNQMAENLSRTHDELLESHRRLEEDIAVKKRLVEELERRDRGA